MSALVRKEIRLLLPAWITALLLVMAPIPLGVALDNGAPHGSAYHLTFYGVAIGCVILGLAGFGREFSSRTFPLLLAQPRPRGEYWRAKIGVLLAALATLALFLGLVSSRFVPPSGRTDFGWAWFVTACVTVTGGLWTTLLFRQVIASFWISALVPFAILASVWSLDDEVVGNSARNRLATVLLLAYSVAGYWFARWQFRHAQDTAWTGGNVALPGLARWWPWNRTGTAPRKSHPLRALLGKEFQFQQINFLLAGLLVLVQFAVLLLQKFVKTTEYSVLDMMMDGFWVIWIVMPMLVGCVAVAEERRLGTLEPQLGLPLSRGWQFTMKILVTLACGVLLGTLGPVVLPGINPLRATSGLEFAAGWALACFCVTLVAFYASSLTNQLLHAFGATIGIIVGWLLLGSVGSYALRHSSLFWFWQGPLVLIIGAGVMLFLAMVLTWRRLRWVWMSLLGLIALGLFRGEIQTLFAGGLLNEARSSGGNSIPGVGLLVALCPVALTLALAAKNFNHTQTSLSLWRRNAATWLGCLVLTGIINTLVYNRVWELALPFEPPAGAPRLHGPIQPAIVGSFIFRATVVLLPDGRLCSFKGYEPISKSIAQTSTNKAAASETTWRRTKNPPVEFVDGSNWVAIVASGRELVGLKSDGSLWKAPWFEQVDQAGNVFPLHAGSPAQKGLRSRPTGLKFERYGAESDWASVAASGLHCVALKRDGTIWGWGHNGNKQLGDGPRFITNAPVQIGQASNWVSVYAGQVFTYALNRDGEIWKWGTPSPPRVSGQKTAAAGGPAKLNLRVPGVRSIIAGQTSFDLILDTDGKLWGLGFLPPALRGGSYNGQDDTEPWRLGGTNWFSISCNWQSLAGLKTDGTLWVQRGHDSYDWNRTRMAQLGKRADWIAVNSDWGADVALAKDGTICRFGEPFLGGIQLLAPTRRVTWSLNLLDAAK